MTTTAASGGRISIINRMADWTLDPDGDLYGDERERMHWYEGIALAAGLQWLLVPWIAAVLVWFGGRDTIVPLAAILVAMYVPCVLMHLYVRSRRVDTTPRTWSARRIAVTALSTVPYVVFVIGAIDIVDPAPNVLRGAVIGGGIGAVLTVAKLVRRTRSRRRLESTVHRCEE